MRALEEVTPRALECAEELRVNVVVGRLGFDRSLLCDDSEKLGARRLAEAGAWAEAICFYMAVLGTGAERPFMNGIRPVEPAWLPALRALRTRALAIMSLDTAELAATQLNSSGIPAGYAASTLVLARLLTQSAHARVPRGTDELRAFRRSLEANGRRPPTGVFAPLVFAETDLDRGTPSRSEPHWRPASTGTVLRYPGRLVTDDHRRAFAQRRTRRGGVVVIDQSGSMEVTPEDVRRMLREAPGALVVGYSHRPGDRGATPNVWVLGARTKVATTCPAGNVGNGVDAPVLAWAIARRRGGEALVWVTDGQVTDSNDYPDPELARDCARLVQRHRVRVVRDLADVARALRTNRPTSRAERARFGRLGRALDEIELTARGCHKPWSQWCLGADRSREDRSPLASNTCSL